MKSIVATLLVTASLAAYGTPITVGFDGIVSDAYTSADGYSNRYAGTSFSGQFVFDVIDGSRSSQLHDGNEYLGAYSTSGNPNRYLSHLYTPPASGPPVIQRATIKGDFGSIEITPWTNGGETKSEIEHTQPSPYGKEESWNEFYWASRFEISNQIDVYQSDWNEPLIETHRQHAGLGILSTTNNLFSDFGDLNSIVDLSKAERAVVGFENYSCVSNDISRWDLACPANGNAVDIGVSGTITKLYYVDDNHTENIPEPSTPALALIGSIALLLRHKFRRAN